VKSRRPWAPSRYPEPSKVAVVQRLALFDLDRTLVDPDTAFLQPDDIAWIASQDREVHPHREVLFSRMRERFALAEPIEELWASYRRRIPELVRCYPA
jgi:FMN phosphatase YigB (HAD superfamily)